jgi:glycosyltransferase involved in cell wall biosynthesis
MTIQIFLSCYKRPEYTKLVLSNLHANTTYKDSQFFLVNDGSPDSTGDLLLDFKKKRPNTVIKNHDKNIGLRKRLLEFFEEATADYLVKIDNDCLFEKNWLITLVEIIKKSGLCVLSPNERTRNPADKHGLYDEKTGCYLIRAKSKAVGGIWIIDRKILGKVKFGTSGTTPRGILGAWQLMIDIRKQCECKIGWTKDVIFEHVGARKANYEQSIQSDEYTKYINEIGRGKNRGWWNTKRQRRGR